MTTRMKTASPAVFSSQSTRPSMSPQEDKEDSSTKGWKGMVLGGGRWIIFVQLYDLSFPLVGCGIKCSALLLFHFRLTLVPRLLQFVDRNHDLRNRKPAGARACVCS